MIDLIAQELGIKPINIIDFDISFIDTQPATLLGIHKEFISSQRLDNQFGSHCLLLGWCELHKEDFLNNDEDINIAIMFDHEEAMSGSMQGAGSVFLKSILYRITEAVCKNFKYEHTI